MSAAYYPQVQKIYVAYYGRPADPAGLQYWAGQLAANGGNLTSIINAFGNSSESTALYAGASDSAKVTAIYQQLFNRAPDAPGLAFYTAELAANRMTAASIALNVANGASGTDLTFLNNKVIVGTAFTDALTLDGPASVAYTGTTAITAARSLITGVTTSAATTNVASTITSIKSGGGATAGQTFTLTTGDDTFVGTTGNDTFNATSKTLSADDRINDSSLTDSDTLNLTATADPAVMSLTNVEKVNITWDAFSTPDIDLDDVVGNTTVTLTSTKAGYQGDANVINAGSIDLVFGTGIDGDVVVSGAEDSSITANNAATLAVSGGDGELTIVANAATSIDVTGGDEVSIAATAAESISISGGGTDVVSLTLGTDATLNFSGDDTADISVSSAEDITVTLDNGGTGFGSITAEGEGSITLALDDAADASGAEITGFATLALNAQPAAAADLTGVDVDTVIELVSGGNALDLTVNDEATVSTLDNDTVKLVPGSDGAGNTINVILGDEADVSGATLEFTSGAGDGTKDFEAAVITVSEDWAGDASGSMNFTVSGAGEYTVISLGDASVEIAVDAAEDNNGSGDAERSVDVSQVAGDVEVDDLGDAGDLTIIGGDGVLTALVEDRDGSGSTVTVVAGDGGSDVSGGALAGGDTLAVMGGDGDDAVEVLSVSGASAVALLGDGDNTLTLGDVNDGGEVELTAGAGDDTFIIASGADFASGSSVTITLGAGDNELTFSGGADISNSGASITITGLETIDFGDSGSDISVQAALLDGQSYMLIGGVNDGNGSGGAASGASAADGGQVTVILASGGDGVDFSDLDLVGLPGLVVSGGGSDDGDYTVVGSEGGDDFDFDDGISGDLTITGGKGTDEFWLEGASGESVTLIFAVGDSSVVGASGDTIDVVTLGSNDGVVSGDIVFDFNLAAATDDNFLAFAGSSGSSGGADDQADAIVLATAAFAADTDLRYYIVSESGGGTSWLFVDSKGDEAPEIGIRIIGLTDATEFTIDNISS